MAPLPSRKDLEELKRVDLQKLCKEYGLKANLKSDELIDRLLEVSTPVIESGKPASSSKRASSRQASATLPPAGSVGPSRASSMIIHEVTDDEAEEDDLELGTGAAIEGEPSLPTRTRKAKELQTKLGKGKPVIAGGSGPRAITVSSSSGSGSRRGKQSSRTMKPREATIMEEPEPLSSSKPEIVADVEAGSQVQFPSTSHLVGDLQGIQALLDAALRPLHDQMEGIKKELTHLSAVKSEIIKLQEQMESLSTERQADSQILETIAMKIDVQSDENRPPSQPTTPKTSGYRPPLGFDFPAFIPRAVPPTPFIEERDTITTDSTEGGLGKRHRETTSTDMAEVIDGRDEDKMSDSEPEKTVAPIRKRAKMDVESSGHDNRPRQGTRRGASGRGSQPQAGPSTSRTTSTFSVFRGSKEPVETDDSALQTNRLSDVPEDDMQAEASTSSGPRTGGIPTSSANAAENQPFNYAFAPLPSTPGPSTEIPRFPFPDQPDSPSPARASLPMSGPHFDARTDAFKTFGLPSPVRPGRRQAREEGRSTLPTAPQIAAPAIPRRQPTSNEVAMALGLTTIRSISTSDPQPPAADPPSHRTMYGTELDNDNRFGDFGVEGVASGFWIPK